MIKAVLFDLDGTVADTLRDLANSYNYAISYYGFPTHETEEYKELVGRGILDAIMRSLPEEHRNDEVIKKCKVIFDEYNAAHSSDYTTVYDGMPETLKGLKKKGIKLAVVTNGAQSRADYMVPNLYEGIFDYIIGKRDGVAAKPSPESAFIAMKELGVNPCECLFVGDSGIDMQTAKNCKAAAGIGVLWGFRSMEELESNGADYIIDRPEMLLDIIEEKNLEL